MKGLVYKGVNDLGIENVPEPQVESSTDAVAKVTLSAICGSDIHIKHGMLPFVKPGTIIGHECCAVIVDVGSDVSNFQKGDRVVASAAFSCGKCFYCRHQQASLCERGGVFGTFDTQGSQAEYVRIPFADNTLAKIPDNLTDEDVLFISDILCTGFHGVIEAGVEVGDIVAVFGSGPVGLCAVASAQLFSPSEVIAVDLEEPRLNIAQKLGAIPINASKEDPVAKIMELTGGRGADVTIEAAGFESTFMGCLQSKRRGGRVSILGLFAEPLSFPIHMLCFDSFKMSIGLGDFRYMNELIRLIQRGKLDLKPIITHRLPLSEAIRGYELFEKKLEGCVKVLLKS